jgi:peptidyl-prolyl cis-trans isomerase D
MFKFIEDIKKHKRNVIAYLVFGAIIIVFVAFNMHDTKNLPQGGFAAQINDKSISLMEYREASQRMSEYYGQMFGGKIDANPQMVAMVRRSALDQLVNREVAAQGAERAGFRATDLEVKDIIVGQAAFQVDGKFKRENYEGYLSYRRLTAGQFEAQLSRDILVQKSKRAFDDALRVNEAQAKLEEQAKNTKVNIAFIKLSQDIVAKSLNVDAKQIDSFKQSEAGQKRITEYFQLNKAKFSKEPEVQARHILVKADANDKNAMENAKKKIEEIAAKAKTEDFSKLATQFSEDVGSKALGGDLGMFGRGKMVPEFDKVAFELPVGQVSGPVKTQFGYHLIKVEKKQEGSTPEIKTVETEIAIILLKEDLYKDKLIVIEAALKEADEKKLDIAIKDLGLKWDETGLTSIAEDALPKVGSSESVSQALPELSKEKPLLAKLAREGQNSFILKLKDSQKAQVTTDLKAASQEMSFEKSSESHSKWIESLAKRFTVKRNEAVLMTE